MIKKNSALILGGCFFLLMLWACKEKDGYKYDKRLLGRWKIVEYHLDNQPAYDTIAKYLEGYEYEFAGGTTTPGYEDVNGFIKIYYQGELSYFSLASFSNYGMSFAFHLTSIPAPQCEVPPGVVIIGGDTASGCFECVSIWDFSFENEYRMEWNAKNTPNSPIHHSHKLIFTKVD